MGSPRLVGRVGEANLSPISIRGTNMPDLFSITGATNTIRLSDQRQAETSFSVFNNSGRQLRGRARIVPLNSPPTAASTGAAPTAASTSTAAAASTAVATPATSTSEK